METNPDEVALLVKALETQRGRDRLKASLDVAFKAALAKRPTTPPNPDTPAVREALARMDRDGRFEGAWGQKARANAVARGLLAPKV